MYVNIKDYKKIHFSSCDGCQESCCSSSKFVMAPLILEDIKLVYNYFPIYFASIDNETRLVMIMSGKENHCPYLENEKCSIYDNRPPTCRLYPLSPYYDEILVDTACKAVGVEGDVISEDGKCRDEFYHERLNNFSSKLQETKEYIALRESALENVDEISGIKIFNYIGQMQDEFGDMIKKSN